MSVCIAAAAAAAAAAAREWEGGGFFCLFFFYTVASQNRSGWLIAAALAVSGLPLVAKYRPPLAVYLHRQHLAKHLFRARNSEAALANAFSV
jgi:hypothetical protein